ncbi:MAG: methyltransferase domain-containing protein [Tissierellia bacterium]|nr:methyltransferase domain-containing protein [Tissierellia bacterium]
MRSALNFVHLLIPEKMDVAIDATVGRGRDSLLLAQRSKKLIGFEIQKEALQEAAILLRDYDVSLYNHCHSQMDKFVKSGVDLIMFNLGYLPGGDKALCTDPSTTELAIRKGLKLLKVGGIILIVAYTHSRGLEEIKMLENLNISQKEADVFRFIHHNGINQPPQAWVLVKK